MRLSHRDDLPYEDVEQIEAELKKQFPGMKIQFAGDYPGELPPEVSEAAKALEKRFAQALFEGRCMDCGKKMPGVWPPPEREDWEPPEGWEYYTDGKGGPLGFCCPKCEAEIAMIPHATQQEAMELEQYDVDWQKNLEWKEVVPQEIIEIMHEEMNNGHPIFVGKHPEKGWFVLAVGPMVLWKQWDV